VRSLRETLHAYRPRPDLLAGRVILVTGSTRGIGRACAEAFAAHGATVVVHGREAATVQQVCDELHAKGYPEPAAVALDLASAATRDYDHVAHFIEAQLGRLDGLVHNASHFAALSTLDDQRIEEWERTLKVNLTAPLALNQACSRLLRAAPDASVLYTLETHAVRPAAYWGAYAVSKAALQTMAYIQADEWSRFAHLRANALVPGPVASPCRSRTHPGEDPSRLSSAENLMPAYLYLLGPDSRGVSGEVFDAQG
jgi:NAD(P)-dependent dehydrogenase (short-subunit alcohol dehydrogenase family)